MMQKGIRNVLLSISIIIIFVSACGIQNVNKEPNKISTIENKVFHSKKNRNCPKLNGNYFLLRKDYFDVSYLDFSSLENQEINAELCNKILTKKGISTSGYLNQEIYYYGHVNLSNNYCSAIFYLQNKKWLQKLLLATFDFENSIISVLPISEYIEMPGTKTAQVSKIIIADKNVIIRMTSINTESFFEASSDKTKIINDTIISTFIINSTGEIIENY